MRDYVVVDGLQELEFSGVHLGGSSTERANSVRWTEIDVYRTEAGNYVIVTQGVSLVYHVSEGGCSSKGEPVKGLALADDSTPCFHCEPAAPEDAGFDPEEVFVHERNFSSAQVVEDPRKVQQAMTTYDSRREITTLSAPAKEALNKAAANDPSLLNQIITRVHVP